MSDKLNAGDSLHILGKHTDFTQVAESLQIEHTAVEAAAKGEEVGIKVKEKVHEGDKVFRVGV
ncbi:MAG: translation elongation factor-like protein [Patescibacteria group bacterium]